MLILSAEQIRKWDAFTIEHQKINSLDLMERAVLKCMEWLETNGYMKYAFSIYCGRGNNGGDGLALARQLAGKNCNVKVYLLDSGHKETDDFLSNLTRLGETSIEIKTIHNSDQFPPAQPEDIIIDALFGSGLNRPVDAITADLIKYK